MFWLQQQQKIGGKRVSRTWHHRLPIPNPQAAVNNDAKYLHRWEKSVQLIGEPKRETRNKKLPISLSS